MTAGMNGDGVARKRVRRLRRQVMISRARTPMPRGSRPWGCSSGCLGGGKKVAASKKEKSTMQDYREIIAAVEFMPEKFGELADAVAAAYARREVVVAEAEETRSAIRDGVAKLPKLAAKFASEEQQGIFARRLAEFIRVDAANSKAWAEYERVRDSQLRTFGECHEPRPMVESPNPEFDAEYNRRVKPGLEAAVAVGGLFAELERRERAIMVAGEDLRKAAKAFADACGKFVKDQREIADGLAYFQAYADEVLVENREYMKRKEAEMAERKRRLGL